MVTSISQMQFLKLINNLEVRRVLLWIPLNHSSYKSWRISLDFIFHEKIILNSETSFDVVDNSFSFLLFHNHRCGALQGIVNSKIFYNKFQSEKRSTFE